MYIILEIYIYETLSYFKASLSDILGDTKGFTLQGWRAKSPSHPLCCWLSKESWCHDDVDEDKGSHVTPNLQQEDLDILLCIQ